VETRTTGMFKSLAIIFYFKMRLFFISLFLLSFYFGYSQNDCKSRYKEDYVPKNLNDAISYLDCKWSEKDKEEFKNKPEDDAVTELHFGTGQAIRNNWGLWKRGKNRLELFFNLRGISHPDDISSIILTSFHRHLSNKDIELKAQIKSYKEYWEKANNRYEEEQRVLSEKLKNQYENYNQGDTVNIAFKLYPKKSHIRAYPVQGYPDLNETGNCQVTGIVLGKRIRKGKDYTLVVKIIEICEYKEVFWGAIRDKHGNFKVGGEYNFFSLKHFKISKK